MERVEAAARELVDAAIAVHRVLGPGLFEATYEAALCIELGARGVAFQRQHCVPVTYRQQAVGSARLDLLIDEVLVVELKSVEALGRVHVAQLLSYLRLTGLTLGLLLNFNVAQMRHGIKRVAQSRAYNPIP